MDPASQLPPVVEPEKLLYKPNIPLLLGVFFLLMMFLGIFLYFYFPKTQTPIPSPEPTPIAEETTPEESLGSTLYEKANNPIADQIPEQTLNVNPIEDAYQNPFE